MASSFVAPPVVPISLDRVVDASSSNCCRLDATRQASGRKPSKIRFQGRRSFDRSEPASLGSSSSSFAGERTFAPPAGPSQPVTFNGPAEAKLAQWKYTGPGFAGVARAASSFSDATYMVLSSEMLPALEDQIRAKIDACSAKCLVLTALIASSIDEKAVLAAAERVGKEKDVEILYIDGTAGGEEEAADDALARIVEHFINKYRAEGRLETELTPEPTANVLGMLPAGFHNLGDVVEVSRMLEGAGVEVNLVRGFDPRRVRSEVRRGHREAAPRVAQRRPVPRDRAPPRRPARAGVRDAADGAHADGRAGVPALPPLGAGDPEHQVRPQRGLQRVHQGAVHLRLGRRLVRALHRLPEPDDEARLRLRRRDARRRHDPHPVERDGHQGGRGGDVQHGAGRVVPRAGEGHLRDGAGDGGLGGGARRHLRGGGHRRHLRHPGGALDVEAAEDVGRDDLGAAPLRPHPPLPPPLRRLRGHQRDRGPDLQQLHAGDGGPPPRHVRRARHQGGDHARAVPGEGTVLDLRRHEGAQLDPGIRARPREAQRGEVRPAEGHRGDYGRGDVRGKGERRRVSPPSLRGPPAASGARTLQLLHVICRFLYRPRAASFSP